MFLVGEEVMGFENLIRFIVSCGRSKAGTERTDRPHLSLLQILYPKTWLLAQSQEEGLNRRSSKIAWLSGWMILEIYLYKPVCLQR